MYETADPGEYGFDEYIVTPGGGYQQYHFNTPFPVYESGLEAYWQESFNNSLSADTRYHWSTAYTDILDRMSSAIVYCVDSESGACLDSIVCTGRCFPGPSQDASNPGETLDESKWKLYNSSADILSIDENGFAEIELKYYTTDDPDSVVVDTVLIVPPGPDLTEASVSDAMPAETEVPSVLAEVVENPVSSSLSIRFNGLTESEYTVRIYDLAGRQVLAISGRLETPEYTERLNVRSLPSGVYVVQISCEDRANYRTISIIR